MKPFSGAFALWALSQTSPAAGAELQQCTCQNGINNSVPPNGTSPTANGTTPANTTNKAYPLHWCDADDYAYRAAHSQLDAEYARPWKLNGTRWCGAYDTGFLPNAKTLIKQTPEMMEKEEWKKQITIPAKTCIRIKCWNTTGLYLCNARRHNITVHTRWDVVPAFTQANYCCQGQAISVVKQRASGEWRHPCGWSAIVAYANCNHAPVTPWPSKITPMQNGSNPNGHCLHGVEEELLAPPVPIDEEPVVRVEEE
ncbi:hypothetical protein MAPG_01861 [Magnaporthiopsis poae ATCC 64411]|uniref:Secreted protein n=1 Tax=Magnaporthiopsis poae (strain ATCC 64411 / 73-15) TaxID=644358 RepID=A0A0C4DPT8_MAGP6|nr:hypothetical protein MAPG_01861 [Magnaporthiopsis poae ATCC 64411]